MVLIPFLSGLFSQQTGKWFSNTTRSLNPLSIGSVFPTQGVGIIPSCTGCLNPLSIGSVFPTYHARTNSSICCVLIPFLSGLFSQLQLSGKLPDRMGLNPLSIGSVFPTIAKEEWGGNRLS